MRLCLALGFLASITRCCCPPIKIPFGQYGDNFASKLAGRVKKSADIEGHLEECSFIDSWQEEPGFINVLAFLDASWEYSHRQAIMLKMLQDRLTRSGISEVRFFVVNSAKAEAATKNSDLEGEKEAWGTVEPSSLEEEKTLSNIERTGESLKKKIDPEIGFIQDTDELKIWEKLSASRDQVLVLDKCGRLTYRIFVPWSILHFPYVKAAILSTYKEQPCGECDANQLGIESVTTTTTTTTTTGMSPTAVYEEESQTEQFPDSLPADFNIDKMKEIAVKTYKLDDIDSTVTKTYQRKEPQDIPENLIKLLNGSASIRQNATLENAFENVTKHQAMLLTGSLDIDRDFAIGFIPDSSDQMENYEKDDHDESESVQNSTETIASTTVLADESTEPENDANLSSKIVTENSVTSKPITVYSVGEKEEGFNEYYAKGDEKQEELKKNKEDETGQGNSETQDFFSIEINGSNDDSGKENFGSSPETSGSPESVAGIEKENNIDRTRSESVAGEEYSQNADYAIPIRIIMHAPHIHKHEEPTRKYEYLVLKLENPEYHGHLEPDEDFYGVNDGDDEKDDEEDEQSKEVNDSDDDHSNKGHNRHHRHRHQHRKVGHTGSNEDRMDVIYDKDESPGFYGEDSEYWRNFGNAGYQEKGKIEHMGKKIEYKEEKEEEGSVNVGANDNHDAIVDDYNFGQETTPTDFLVTETQKIFDEDATKEAEMTNRLIKHYSKLIPWLDYVFEK